MAAASFRDVISYSPLRRFRDARKRLRGLVALMAVVLVLATLPRLEVHAHATPHDHDVHSLAHDHHGDSDDSPTSADVPSDMHVHQAACVTVALPDLEPLRFAHRPPESWPGPMGRNPPAASSAVPPYRPPIA